MSRGRWEGREERVEGVEGERIGRRRWEGGREGEVKSSIQNKKENREISCNGYLVRKKIH